MLTLSHVYAGYDGGDVLRDVSASFETGGCYSVLGPNGCGKTTLLRSVCRMIDMRGDVLLDGRNVTSFKRAELAAQVALMSQLTTLYFPYTVEETVMLGRYRHMRGRLFARPDKADRAAVECCLRMTDLTSLRGERIDRLSGGQRQRVFLAQTLAQEPRVILLDEPTNHLDVRCQLELIDALHAWCADGEHTVIGVFHDMNLALRLSERMLFLKDGAVAGFGCFSELVTGDFLQNVYGMDVAGYMRGALEPWMKVG